MPENPSRRQVLKTFANGFGMLALADLFNSPMTAGAASVDSAAGGPLALRPPHFEPRAKNIIFLFMSGGPSHVDLFDPKPRLQADHGKPLPFEKPKLERTKTGNLLASPWKFQKHGQSGVDVSELLPHTAGCIDDLCVIRSMVADNINHNGACLQMNTGEQAFSRPSLGSWLLYGLGSENQNLPGFVVISPSQPAQGAPLWSSSFLPAAYQGTLVSNLSDPIANLSNEIFDKGRQRSQLDRLRELNELHAAEREEDSRLSARIASFELAYRMQMEAPEAFDVESESEATKKLYGLDQPTTSIFGRQCLMARRLVERGVRFVQVYHRGWDVHGNLPEVLPSQCKDVDQGAWALVQDLKQRGMLDDTLVIWGGEFGRTIYSQGKLTPTDYGRDHHPRCFSLWLAGGGIKGGVVHGETDEFSYNITQDPVHVRDLQATILHAFGINHEKFTYKYQGLDQKLTGVERASVVDAILA